MGEAQLSARELDCLRLAAQGHTGLEIARKLGISERTVRFHFKNVCTKFGVERRVQAVAIAVERKLLDPGKARTGKDDVDGQVR